MTARIAALLLAMIFTACGSAAPTQVAASATTVTLATATAAPAATGASSNAAAATSAAASPIAAKVSANNATNAQLIATFTAAGIPNPSSWAREVQEYRPYDVGDANLTKLRQNLAKYKPAAGVVDKIVATLSLP